ncbi:tyrosine-type recombinase/integrase [Patescibacteria group bacterium]|nr:tyrosine-type recombinase/integrase [Patescibacteria group bacterium]MCG2701509.1 tyrosine-type recombinase/integrase [Candidatus Parcubacteria bacterium]MBU4209820.1 tyrosine-type recombinase/integrase [Patescibacteria group bacterium]MBU4265288.1 tyrosine-type recombinase/integrase [Patescibacteria group bacterium]MBU4389973.1 tyrosine-type recombinase/integrase [Patescibacteria group bacterium]
MNRNLTDLVRRFLEYLEIERNCSQLTIRNYKHYLDELCVFLFAEKKLNKLEIDDIGMEEVRRFRLYLSRKKGRNGEMKIVTQGYYIIALRSFLKWLIKNDYRVLQPEKLDVPKRKSESLKFLDIKQVEKLLNQPILSTRSGLRDRAILELLFSTGLRVSELVALNRSNVDIVSREFGVIGKGGRARVVFISKKAANLIDRYLRTRIDKYKPLFVRYAGKYEFGADDESYRLTSRSIQRLVKKYVKKAKLPVDATPHTLRHSMATDLLRSGADIRSVQEILGHKNIATTQIYTHVTDKRLREVHNKFHSGNR